MICARVTSLARVAHQIFQQRKFLGRQFDRPPRRASPLLHAIQFQVLDPQHHFRRARRAAAERARARTAPRRRTASAPVVRAEIEHLHAIFRSACDSVRIRIGRRWRMSRTCRSTSMPSGLREVQIEDRGVVFALCATNCSASSPSPLDRRHIFPRRSCVEETCRGGSFSATRIRMTTPGEGGT